MKFQSKRLLFREFTLNDYENLLSLDRDPEVLRFINDGKPFSPEDVRATIDRILKRYQEDSNLATWATELKDTKEFIGWFGVKPLLGTPDIEVGYRLKKKFWGQGYATEGARVMVEQGFATGLKKLVAITHPGNLASQKVLRKVGFQAIGSGPFFSTLLNREMTVEWFEVLAQGPK